MKHKDGKRRDKRLKPIAIPSSVNTYDELIHAANQGMEEARVVVKALDETMVHFNIPLEQRRKIGDVLQRFSMMLALQDERVQVTLKDDDPMHHLIDMVEYLQRRVQGEFVDEKFHLINYGLTVELCLRLLEG
jgi:hypothetical protein